MKILYWAAVIAPMYFIFLVLHTDWVIVRLRALAVMLLMAWLSFASFIWGIIHLSSGK